MTSKRAFSRIIRLIPQRPEWCQSASISTFWTFPNRECTFKERFHADRPVCGVAHRAYVPQLIRFTSRPSLFSAICDRLEVSSLFKSFGTKFSLESQHRMTWLPCPNGQDLISTFRMFPNHCHARLSWWLLRSSLYHIRRNLPSERKRRCDLLRQQMFVSDHTDMTSQRRGLST